MGVKIAFLAVLGVIGAPIGRRSTENDDEGSGEWSWRGEFLDHYNPSISGEQSISGLAIL